MKAIRILVVVLLSQIILAELSTSFFAQSIASLDEMPMESTQARISSIGEVRALVVFAAFKDQPQEQLPQWINDIFNPQVPNSLTHYYNVQSGGKHIITGDVLPRWYYTDYNFTPNSRKEKFIECILEQVDADVDFSKYDNWTGHRENEPDGKVDIIFINIANNPWRSTASLELKSYPFYFESDDTCNGRKVKIYSQSGTAQDAQSDFEMQVGGMAHEYGHTLGLVDLYDFSYYESNPCADDFSAGIGFWGLMSEGYGMHGLYAMSEFSKMQLGWVSVIEVSKTTLNLKVEPGAVYIVRPRNFSPEEYFMVTYRDHTNCYDSKLPKGMLIWHIDETKNGLKNLNEFHKYVDLECADGLFEDRGCPGKFPNPVCGGDNLDFWAKNNDCYCTACNGNPYDENDPFDGVKYTSFTPYTNPSSNGYCGDEQRNNSHVAITNIRPDGRCDVIFNYWGGRLACNTIWPNDSEPYYLCEDISVPESVTLHIQQGAKIETNGFQIISSGGTIVDENLTTGISGNESAPGCIALHPNYPNPFNATTQIQYELKKSAQVKLAIYNAMGQRVKILVDEEKSSGLKTELWDGCDYMGRAVSSGVYYAVMKTSGQIFTTKMLLLR